jgi:hypothetical protein
MAIRTLSFPEVRTKAEITQLKTASSTAAECDVWVFQRATHRSHIGGGLITQTFSAIRQVGSPEQKKSPRTSRRHFLNGFYATAWSKQGGLNGIRDCPKR